MKFEWDDRKERINLKKHKVSFSEAKSLFYNENAIVYDDYDHSFNEDRFIIVGFSASANLLLVCFCEKLSGDIIRIISARKLTKKEKKDFNKRWLK